MFGPQHLTHVIRYLDGVDCLSGCSGSIRQMSPLSPMSCVLYLTPTLNAQSVASSYSVDQLNADLAAVGDGLDFEVRLDTYPHNTAMERHVSQSDFGLVLTYDNRILPKESWSTAYLVQAKRLFRSSYSGEYDQRASFQAVNAAQQATPGTTFNNPRQGLSSLWTLLSANSFKFQIKRACRSRPPHAKSG